MEFRPMEAELFNAIRRPDRQAGRQAGGRRDMMKLIVAFRNFANALSNKKLQTFQLYTTPFQVI
jgi:hypothetical protein